MVARGREARDERMMETTHPPAKCSQRNKEEFLVADGEVDSGNRCARESAKCGKKTEEKAEQPLPFSDTCSIVGSCWRDKCGPLPRPQT